MTDFNELTNQGAPAGSLSLISVLLNGLPFSFAIMGILFAHEMGHYLMCRYYRVDASLPYFIPLPILSLVGTLGAFISVRSPFQHRQALLEMGIAGPIAGFVVAIPALFFGLSWSTFVPLAAIDTSAAGIRMGEPLMFKLVASLLGMQPPDGTDIYLHPVGLAAWFGIFVTALNLIPAGQLDGGHVIYALFGRRQKHISFAVMAALVVLGIVYWVGWLFWLLILVIMGRRFGFRHPPTLNDYIPLPRHNIWLGWIALAMFVLCFTPAPFVL
jgi:membrane-associated protease RseP (regulator of RpoE activity)